MFGLHHSRLSRTDKRQLVGRILAFATWIAEGESLPSHQTQPTYAGGISSLARRMASRDTLPILGFDEPKTSGIIRWLASSDRLPDRAQSPMSGTGVLAWLTARESLPDAGLEAPLLIPSTLRWLLMSDSPARPGAAQHSKEVPADEP